MGELADTYLEAEITTGCALEFIDEQRSPLVPYVCGKCAVLAVQDTHGITTVATGTCERLLIDSIGHDYDEPLVETQN